MHSTGSRPLRPLLLLALISLPIFCTYVILIRQFVPIPLLDDYTSVLAFAETFNNQPSAMAKLSYTFAAQHNEYKVILVHVVVGLQMVLLHRVSLSFLAALGNLAPTLILVVLWLNAFRGEPDQTRRLFLFLPVPFLLFQLNYAEAFDWAMPTLQNLGVIAFSLLSIHLLLLARRSTFWWAVASALLACSASIGGFLLAPLGCIALLSRRNYRALLFWGAPFALMLLLYAYRYVRLPKTPHPALGDMPLFFLSFAGGAYENMHHKPLPYLSVALGLAMLVALFAMLRYQPLTRNPFLFLATLFILGTVALATFGRAGTGLSASLSVRYKIYSDLLLIVTYLTFVERLLRSSRVAHSPASHTPKRFVIGSLMVAMLLYTGSGVVGYRFLSKRRSQLIDGMRQYQASPSSVTPMINPNETASPGFDSFQELAREVLTRSIQLGIYSPPVLPDDLHRPR